MDTLNSFPIGMMFGKLPGQYMNMVTLSGQTGGLLVQDPFRPADNARDGNICYKKDIQDVAFCRLGLKKTLFLSFPRN
jgi:hypothetical protein